MMIAVGLRSSPQSIKYQLGYLLLQEPADEKLEHKNYSRRNRTSVSVQGGIFNQIGRR